MRRTFKDNRLQAAFEEDGYVLIPGFLNQEEIAAMREQYFSTEHDLGEGFHATMHSSLVDYRREVMQSIGEVFYPKSSEILEDYRQLVSNYTVKEPGPDSFFDFHLDWNMVDETTSRSVTLWCPLEDMREENGNLWIMEKSNQLGDSYRAGPGLSLYFEEPGELQRRSFKRKTVCTKAGDAIIYDHKLFHGSPPNLSDKPRLAINHALAAREFSAVHYLEEGPGKISMYEVDDDFFCRCIIGQQTEMGAKVKEIQLNSRPVEQEIVNAMMDTEIRSKEPVRDDELFSSGYTVIEGFLQPSVLDSLRTGAVGDESEESLVPQVCRARAEYFENAKDIYTAKSQGWGSANGPFQPFQDWSVVDEEVMRAYALLIPLEEVSEGCLVVLPSSHMTFFNRRGKDIEQPYIDHVEFLKQEYGQSVVLKRGDAFVYDTRLVRFIPDEESISAIRHLIIPETAALTLYSKSEHRDTLNEFIARDNFFDHYSEGQELSENNLAIFRRNVGHGDFKYDIDQLKAMMVHWPGRRIFHSYALEHRLLRDGVFSLELLNDDEIEQAYDVYRQTDNEVGEVKYNTLEVDDYKNRKAVADGLDNLIGDKIRSFFRNYKSVGYNFAVKKALSDHAFPAHVDDIHADEDKYISVNVWIPLVDVHDLNGSLYMVKGSHRIQQPIRGIGLPFPFETYRKLIESNAIPPRLKAGEALFFHTKMIHGSDTNKTDKDRPAIITGLVPEEATPILFFQHEELDLNQVELFVAEPEMYLKLKIGKRPSFAKSLGVFDYDPIDYPPQLIRTLMGVHEDE